MNPNITEAPVLHELYNTETKQVIGTQKKTKAEAEKSNQILANEKAPERWRIVQTKNAENDSTHKYQLFFSNRNIPLILTEKWDIPFITVENYIKWYDLFIVHPDGKVEKLMDNPEAGQSYHNLEKSCGFCAVGDHSWHPHFVQQLAQQLGFGLDDITLETLVGRWMLEHNNMTVEQI